MDSGDYLGYIAYFYKNIAQLSSKEDFIGMLKKNLGTSMFNAPLPKLRDTARLMYKGYVASMYAKYSAFYIISNLDSKNIDSFITDTIALNKQYGLFYETVDYSLSLPKIDAVIKRQALPNYKSIFSDLLGEKKVTAKKTSAKKTGAKKTTKVTAKKVTAKKTTAKKTSAKKTTAKKTTAKKTLVLKSCSDYSVAELKSMASALKIPGASRMKKEDLCSSLGF